MTLPVAVLDHIVVNVHQAMEAGEESFRRLGFALTPRGYHTLGSINHLAIFATDYLELIALPESASGRQDLLTWPVGWNGVVFNTEDAEGLGAALGVAPNDFSRPVAGLGDAVFRTVRLANDTTPAGRLYFCQHKTRDLVWRDEWRTHPNGVVGIARIVYGAEDPSRLMGVFSRLFPSGVRETEDGFTLAAGMVTLEVVRPSVVAARYGLADPAGRAEWTACVVFRVVDLSATLSVLAGNGVVSRAVDGGVLVEGMGAALVFSE